MAQIVDYYKGEAQGGATFYRYLKADNTSTAVRIYNGDNLTLPADYRDHSKNGMYRIIYPDSRDCRWMYKYNIGSLEPVYKTITDPCTPPDELALEGKTLVITGGAGGDLNDLTGFGLSFRDRQIGSDSWGEWSEETLSPDRTVEVSASPGAVRQFRVRTQGTAGEEYYSDYVVLSSLLNGNSASGTPVVELPVPGCVACCHTPAAKVVCPPDPDGDAITVMRSIDGGEWTAVETIPGAGGWIFDRMPYLHDGPHTVAYRAMDANGAASESDCVTFTIDTVTWRRAIAPGTVIANEHLSHRDDLEEMLLVVNRLRAFYGLEPVAWPAEPGRFSDWQGLMRFLFRALDDTRTIALQPIIEWPEIPSWPSAHIINAIREVCHE